MHSTDTPATQEQSQALAAARELVYVGVPVFRATPCPPGCHGDQRAGWHRPRGWESTPAYDLSAVDDWRPGDALCAVMGHALDLIDVDTRSGGDDSASVIIAAGAMPYVYASASTPSGGVHYFVAALGAGSRDGVRPGVDVKGGRPDGSGRGYAFIAPTVAPSKVDGQARGYRWIKPPSAEHIRAEVADDASGGELAAIVREALGPKTPVPDLSMPTTSGRFATHREWWTADEARDECERIVAEFAGQGYAERSYNARLNELAFRVGHFVGGGFLEYGAAAAWLYEAAAACGMVTAPPGYTYVPDGERTVRGTIRSGLDDGMRLPYMLFVPPDLEKDAGTAEIVPGDAVDALLAEMLTVDELMTMPAPRPLVNGLLDLDTTSWLIGKPGSYKSFVALDLAAHVGAGKPWHGRAVSQGEAIYIVAEGVGGTRLRVAAWQRVHGPMTGVRFLPRPVQAGDERAWAVLVEACRRVGPSLVVIDTQARVTVGMDENDNTEMGGYIERADEIKRACGACVLTVHHIGRNGTDARGASAIDGAQDAELRVERTADRRVTIHMDKAKDSDDALTLDMELLKVDGGVDPETLRDLSSLVVVPVGTLPTVISKPWLDNLPEHQAAIIGVIADHAPHHGATKPEVRALLAERYPMARTSFNTAWDGLINKGIITRIEASQRWVLTSMVVTEKDLSSQNVDNIE